METTILKSIDKEHQSHYWYGGDCAKIEHNGYTAYICANGDIDVNYIKNEVIIESFKDTSNSGVFFDVMKHYIKNDNELYKKINYGSLEITYNNWWECFIIDKNGINHDVMWALDSDYLEDAIEEVHDGLDEVINDIENKKNQF